MGKRLVRCQEHGLHYDASAATGCPVCLRGSTEGPRAPRSAFTFVGVGLVIACAGALYFASRPEDAAPLSSSDPAHARGAPERPVEPRERAAVPYVPADSDARVARALVAPLPQASAYAELPAPPDRYVYSAPPSDDPADLERDCSAGQATSCVRAAHIHRFGRGGHEKNFERARKLYGTACTSGDATSCLQLGFMEQKGEGAEPNDDAAYEHFRRSASLADTACKEGDRRSCLILADAYRNGRGVPKDMNRARELFDSVAPGLGSITSARDGGGD